MPLRRPAGDRGCTPRTLGRRPSANFLLALLAVALTTVAAIPAQNKPQRPKPERLDAGVVYRRDPASGELRAQRARRAEKNSSGSSGGEAAAEAPAKITVRVSLVEVGVNVAGADGNEVRGLAREDFRVFEDGAEQAIAYFDASSDPAAIVLVIDASPSVLREFSQMRRAARALAANLSAADELAVVAFAGETYLTLPFTTDRRLLERAIESLDVLRGEQQARGSKVYESVYLAVEELFAGPRGAAGERVARPGRKAIVLLTDGQDSGLGLGWDASSAAPRAGAGEAQLTFEDVCRALAARGVEVYAVSTQTRPRAMTDEWLAANRAKPLVTPQARERGWAHYTLYLAELVRRAGGRIFFLSEIGTLADVYRRIAENLRGQYVLGFYPAGGPAGTGWRSLRVELRDRQDVGIAHRPAYYLPAAP